MKKVNLLYIILLITIIFIVAVIFGQITGRVFENGSSAMVGPSPEEQACMQSCTSEGCEAGDTSCMESNSGRCGTLCGVDVSGPPEPVNEDEACMQQCVVKGCDKFDFQCEGGNKDSCEDECGMKGDAPDASEMGAEQLCISECVAATDPEMICGNSQEGETGGALCQQCADSCVHLYEGPCLNDEQLTEKEKECETCEHCYGEPVTGSSGQGWDCIVDVECNDASGEFGDEAGTGPGIGQEGFVAKIGDTVGNIFGGIGDFFKGIFGGGKSEEPPAEEPQIEESSSE